MALSLMFSIVALVPFGHPASADGTVAGHLWVDLDADREIDADGSVLRPFGVIDGLGREWGAAGVHVRLLTVDGDELAATVSASDGTYAFPTQPDGVYELEFEAPVGFDFASTFPEGDHSATSDPAPLPGFRQFARTVVIVDGADAIVGSVGLRPTASLDISWVDVDPTVDGVQAIATGTPPFASCSSGVAAPGEDCGPNDDVVRTNDITSFTVSVSGDNIDEALNPLPEVILEQRITPIDGAEVSFDIDPVLGVPTGCLTSDVTRRSSVTRHDDGSSTLVCNIGDFDTAEVNFLTTNVVVSGDSPPGSSFEFSARGYAGLSNAVATPILDAEPVIVSASPRFDLTMNRDESNTRNRVFEQARLEERVNPVTGASEPGKVFYYDVSLLAEGDGVGAASLDERLTFTNVIDPVLAQHGATLQSCSAGPFNEDGAAALPATGSGAPYSDRAVADNGTWTCDYDPDRRTIDVVVTGADTSAAHLPTEGADGSPLADLDVVLTGNIKVWYPLSAFMRSADPDWQPNDPVIAGTYSIYNCVADFDPESGFGAGSNYGDGVEPGYGEGDYDPEPTGNNCRFHSFQISEPGSFFLRYGGNDRLDLGVQADLWPCAGDPDQGIVARQTQCDSGDGPVAGGQNYYIEIAGRNQEGLLPVKDQWLCGVLDNSIATIRPITAGPSAGTHGFAQYRSIDGTYAEADPSAWVTEYARFTAAAGQTTWRVDHDVTGGVDTNGIRRVDTTEMDLAAADCGQARTATGELEWTTDLVAAGWDPGSVVLVRTRPVDDSVEVGAGEDLVLYVPMQARRTYFGDAAQPGAGALVEPGAIVPVVGNHRAYGEFGDAGYDPNAHAGRSGVPTVRDGDRLIVQEVRLGLQLTARHPTSSAGADDLRAVAVGEPILWSAAPTVIDAAGEGIAENLRLEIVLPEWAILDPSCMPPPPAGSSEPLVTEGPDDGETTVTWFLGAVRANTDLAVHEVCAMADPFSPAPLDLIARARLDADNTTTAGAERLDVRTVRVTQRGGMAVLKSVDQSHDFPGENQTWTLRWGNLSPRVALAGVDVIDVFPFNGDGITAPAGREFHESAYAGSLELAAVPPTPFQEPIDGGDASPVDGLWYFSADDPSTISHDPLAPSNALPGGRTTWCSANVLAACGLTLSDVTAARWVSSGDLAPQTVVRAEIVLVAGARGTNTAGDLYVNRFAAHSPTFPTLSLRSNEPWVQVVGFTLGDRIFADLDGNGLFDVDVDRPVDAGVRVELFDRFDRFVASTETDDRGRWSFERLLPGSYYVVIPDAFADGGPLAGWAPSTAGFGVDPNTDLDDDADHHATLDDARPGAVRSSGLIVLSAQRDAAGLIVGDEPTGDDGDLDDTTARDDLTNMGLDLALTPPIEIDIEAALNAVDPLAPTSAEDADLEPGRVVAAGEPQRFTYLVANPGEVGLVDVVVADDNGTTLTSDDWFAEPVEESVGPLGDLDGDGVLDPGEVWLYAVDAAPTSGPRRHTASVTAARAVGGAIVATDDDTTVYRAVAPSISVEMATTPQNAAMPTVVEDADDAPGMTLLEGSEVWWSYLVTTVGDAALTDVVVVDDAGTETPDDDMVAEAVLGEDDHNVGDLDADGMLDAGEIWRFRSPEDRSIVAGAAVYTGRATVRASAPSVVGPDGRWDDGRQVTATDVSHHHGGTAGVELESYLVGTQVETPEDADDAPGPDFTTGLEVGWRYVVTNVGSIGLTEVTVVSDNGTPIDVADDLVMSGRPTAGDEDADGELDPGESWVYSRSSVPGDTGEVAELAVASAAAVTPIVVGSQPQQRPSDADATHFRVVEPPKPLGSIGLTKEVCLWTSNRDCDVDDDRAWTEVVERGAKQKALWRITVTNDGETDLRQVKITDDQVRSCSRTLNGMEPGDREVWRCTSGTVPDSMVNVAVVQASSECNVSTAFDLARSNGRADDDEDFLDGDGSFSPAAGEQSCDQLTASDTAEVRVVSREALPQGNRPTANSLFLIDADEPGADDGGFPVPIPSGSTAAGSAAVASAGAAAASAAGGGGAAAGSAASGVAEALARAAKAAAGQLAELLRGGFGFFR